MGKSLAPQLPESPGNQSSGSGGRPMGAMQIPHPPVFTQDVSRALVQCPDPSLLSLTPGDPGIPPAKPDGEGAALLQLRCLWDPICGPGEWH